MSDTQLEQCTTLQDSCNACDQGCVREFASPKATRWQGGSAGLQGGHTSFKDCSRCSLLAASLANTVDKATEDAELLRHRAQVYIFTVVPYMEMQALQLASLL